MVVAADRQEKLVRQSESVLREMQQALVSAAGATIDHQQELVKQGEVLLKVVDSTGQVQRLEDSLNRNLSSLARGHNFEETLMSLSAAIQLLSARVDRVVDTESSLRRRHETLRARRTIDVLALPVPGRAVVHHGSDGGPVGRDGLRVAAEGDSRSGGGRHRSGGRSQRRRGAAGPGARSPRRGGAARGAARRGQGGEAPSDSPRSRPVCRGSRTTSAACGTRPKN